MALIHKFTTYLPSRSRWRCNWRIFRQIHLLLTWIFRALPGTTILDDRHGGPMRSMVKGRNSTRSRSWNKSVAPEIVRHVSVRAVFLRFSEMEDSLEWGSWSLVGVWWQCLRTSSSSTCTTHLPAPSSLKWKVWMSFVWSQWMHKMTNNWE